MSSKVIGLVARALLAASLLVTVSSRANATVYDLSALASSHADILYQWTFDAGAEGGLRDATSGSVGLSNARTPVSLAYASDGAGFDTSTRALRSYQETAGTRATGAALRTTSSLSLPESGTVEFLFNVVTAVTDGVTYIVSAELATVTDQSRRHFGAVDGSGASLRTGFGSTWANTLPVTGMPLTANEWYYVALTFEPSSGKNLVNAYVANLTNGDAEATHTLVDLNTNATAGPITVPALGLGCFGSASGNYNHFFDGFVDQVSIYGARLAHDDINAHVAAIQEKPNLRVDLDVYRNYPSVHPVSANWMPDASSWNNDAFLGNSATTTTYNPSRGTYGFYFDPADGGDMLTLNRNESLRVADIGNGKDMSVEMWLRPDTIPASGSMALVDTRASTEAAGGWMLTLRDNGSIRASFYGTASGNTVTLDSDLGLLTADGSYQHLVMSLDANESGGGEATFYLNGQEWGTAAYSDGSKYVEPTTSPFRIGHQRTAGTTSVLPFHGEISGFALYSAALNQEEVLARFALGVPEPTTFGLAIVGILCMLAARGRTRRDQLRVG